MQKTNHGRIAWSSSLVTQRPKKPKETDWFRRILVGLQEDAKALSKEVMGRIHRATIVVAQAIGGGWSNFRHAHAAVKATVLAPQVVGERLSELFALSYLKPGTDRPTIDHRGDVILAVEDLIGPRLEGDERKYVVTTHQRRYAASASFLREHGISSRFPMLISTEERQELRALMFAAKWGEAEGYFEKSWTVREDGSLEIGLHPAGSSKVDDVSGVVLYQHRTDKVDDLKRERWVAVQEQKRTARGADAQVMSWLSPALPWETPFFTQNRFMEHWHETTFDIHDAQDRQVGVSPDFKPAHFAGANSYRFIVRLPGSENLIAEGGHPGYEGLVPLNSPTLVENQLQTRRVRARMGWEVRAYQKKGETYSRISKDKVVLCADGRLWTPEDSDGNKEQDYFADPRQTLAWKDKESGRWITRRRWNKLVMQKSMLEFMVPKGPNEQGNELYDHVSGRDITSSEAISYLHDRSVITRRDPVFRRELEGMFLSAVEHKAYANLAFFRKERGFGSPEFPIVINHIEVPHPETGEVMRVKTSTPCKRCNEKWGTVQDAVKANWVEQPHAYICLSCGSEVWKVGVRVFVEAKYFPFVLHRSNLVTHYAAEFYGPWVRELLVATQRDRVAAEVKALQA